MRSGGGGGKCPTTTAQLTLESPVTRETPLLRSCNDLSPPRQPHARMPGSAQDLMPSALVTKRQKVTHRSRHCHSKSKPLSLRSHSAKLSMLTPSPVHHGTIRSSLSLVTLLRPPTPFLLKVRGVPPFEVYHLVRAICPSVSSGQPHLSTFFSDSLNLRSTSNHLLSVDSPLTPPIVAFHF